MKFSEFIGNSDSVKRLKKQIENNRTFHAYIFEGSEGSGKKLLADTMAQALLCKNLSDKGEPCQICSACRKVLNNSHSDIHYITPSGISIKDEQIEEIQEVLYSKPFDGDTTILIMEKAHTMTVRAQNRLLKTLEEPAKSVKIILLTERIGDLLPTILSRSVVVRLKPVNSSEIKAFLINKMGAELRDSEIAAAYSCGSPGKAVRLLCDEDFAVRRNNSIKCACAILEKKTLAEFMYTFDEEYLSRENIVDFLDMMSFWYRDVLLLAQGMEIGHIMNKDCIEKLMKIKNSTDLKIVCKIIEKIEEAKYDILMNVNVNYALRNMYLE